MSEPVMPLPSSNADLDRWLAENVMRWGWVQEYGPRGEPVGGYWVAANHDVVGPIRDWSPTTNANHALEVLEKLKLRWTCDYTPDFDGEESHTIDFPEHDRLATAEAPTFPLAVARAVHKLVSGGQWSPE